MRAAPLILLPSLLLLAACSDDRSQDLPPGEATLSLDGLVTEQARVFCQLLFSCGPDGSDNLEARLILETPAKCQQYLLSSGTFDTTDLVRAVEAGVVRYDGAAAKRCVAAIGQSCESLDFETSPEACDLVFVGTVAMGGACQRSEECSGAAFCAKTSSTAGPVCPGRCTAQRPQGAECESSAQCDAAGLTGAPICTYTQEGENYVGRCRERRVGAPAAVGQACGFDQATATTTPCADGLVCGRNPRVCVTPLARGASCSPDASICADTDVCRAETQGGAPSCGPIQVVSTVGANCASPTTYCNPLSLLTCEEGTCAATRAPGGALGNRCERGDFSVPCDAGLYCAGEVEGTRTCAAKVALGGACDADNACLDGSCVDGRCAARDCRAYWQ